MPSTRPVEKIGGTIEAVFWLDAAFDSGNKTMDEVSSFIGVYQLTVGIVLPETGDGHLRIISERSLSMPDFYKHLIFIPKGMFVKRIKLPMFSVNSYWKKFSLDNSLPSFV